MTHRRWFAVRAICLVALVFIALAPGVPLTAAGPLDGVKVCLDAGHGGADPGAVNETYGLHESEINLDVAYAVKDLLESDGAEVVMPRVDDTYLENRDRYTFCNDEQATLLVSIHTNSAVNTTLDGSMALYFKSEDKVLAQAMYDAMYPVLRDSAPSEVTFIDWGLSRYASGVLMKSDMPAAMMEPVLMSNPYEAPLLVESIAGACPDLLCRRGQIARVVHQGVLDYMGGAGPGGAFHVVAIAMDATHRGPNYTVSTTVTIQDEDGNPVSGAEVSIVTDLDGVPVFSGTATTGDDGSAGFRLRIGQPGTFVSTVTAVTKDGWTYDAEANVETSDSLTVP